MFPGTSSNAAATAGYYTLPSLPQTISLIFKHSSAHSSVSLSLSDLLSVFPSSSSSTAIFSAWLSSP